MILNGRSMAVEVVGDDVEPGAVVASDAIRVRDPELAGIGEHVVEVVVELAAVDHHRVMGVGDGVLHPRHVAGAVVGVQAEAEALEPVLT